MLTFSFANIKLYALFLILKISLGSSQSLNNTEILAIASDVQNLRFKSAQDKILNNTESDPEMVAAIIQHVYSNTENNTQIILDFANNVTLAGLRFYIRGALRSEMAANNHSDPIKLISLYHAYEDEMDLNDSPYSLTNGQTLSPVMRSIFEELQASVKASAKQILKDALIANSFEENEYVKNVTSELYYFVRRIEEEVMRELAIETYPLVSAVQLAESIMVGSKYMPQKITFFEALYEQLEINNDLNNEAVLKIAYFFRIFKKSDTYRNLFTPKKYAVNEIIKRMPICARNLYFSFGLCIWNRGRSEYLYAASSQHNLSRRGIFTYGMNHITEGGIWIAEHYDEHVYLESFIYNKEYLYASTTDKYSPTMRHVLTWVDDGFVGDTCAWKIELNGDYCYLKNVNFNEYLYTSDRIHAEKKRYVFTANTGAIFDQPDFQWQIRNCG